MAHWIFDHYGERLARRGRHDQTIWNYRCALGRYSEWLEEKGLDPLTIEPWQVEEFFDSLTYAATTKRLYLQQVRAVYRYAMRRGVIGYDPTVDVEISIPTSGQPRVLNVEDLRAMKSRCFDEKHFTMFHLYAYTGLRRDEGRLLTWDSVDLRSNTIAVVGKGGKRRMVPIHPALGELFVSQPRIGNRSIIPGRQGGNPSTRSMWDWLRHLSEDATFHDFRRTVASSLDANGVEEGVIMRIMGWAPRSIFDRHYRNVADNRLQMAILKLYADKPI